MSDKAKRLPRWAEVGRQGWTNVGERRPPFAQEPGEGQESVWDYPRPPALVGDDRRVRVVADGLTIVDTRSALRILETSHPPTFYLPPDDVDWDRLELVGVGSRCEWKGAASYYDLRTDTRRVPRVAWAYHEPFEDNVALAGYVSFYPAQVECFVDDERVRPQPGGFYGGWITDELVGPFKGDPGTSGW